MKIQTMDDKSSGNGQDSKIDLQSIDVILVTDCGSTTSKARFFRRVGNEYRFIAAGEAPTTVEAPFEDVTQGLRNAVREVEELTGHKLLSSDGIISPREGDNEGVDLYVTTSSAGGGLQMLVTGVVRNITAESAERTALGAGAIVIDVLAINDGHETWERIEKMRFLRPDMILFSGGTDGGNFDHVVQIAEILRSGDPKHRLGNMYSLPIVYAGNRVARAKVDEILGTKYSLKFVDNIRPEPQIENLAPARNAIQEQFMEHVMSHAPGYDKLMKWTPVPIMPTPMGEGTMFKAFAEVNKANLIGVGLGGATTNIYSIYNGKFVRSVSANYGMSYSICNILKEAGLKRIMRWIPLQISEDEVLDILRNKMIRPTTIPQTLDQLLIEHGAAREALRMAFQQHKSITKPLVGDLENFGTLRLDDSRDYEKKESYIDLLNVDWLGGTGGLISHAPRKAQSALILIDGFGVEGVTSLFQDSVFMMPHLGVLSSVHRESAVEIFEKDCLVRLGTCIAFKGQLKDHEYGRRIGTVTLTMPDGEKITEEAAYGTIKKIPLKEGEIAIAEIKPEQGFQIMEKGLLPKLVASRTANVHGGAVGIIIDARGRPIDIPEDDDSRREKLEEWFTALDAYPKTS
ncbi:MAG: hypothetical protein QG670_1959 [Thermoproteota archaeon]|nr:hypothetical protein [Thermoproteota archaeon]